MSDTFGQHKTVLHRGLSVQWGSEVQHLKAGQLTAILVVSTVMSGPLFVRSRIVDYVTQL